MSQQPSSTSSSNPNSSSSQADWNNLLRHSSSIGIAKHNGHLPSRPNPRLVRTGHDANGLAVFVADQAVDACRPLGPQGSGFFHLDLRASVPVDNTQVPGPSSVIPQGVPRTPPRGVSVSVTEIAPLFSVPMHRTLSIDYAVVLSGEIVCELDGGEEKVMGEGEFVIQQGTNHRWHNRRQEPCRILFVMVAADRIVLGDGRVLEETVIPVQRD